MAPPVKQGAVNEVRAAARAQKNHPWQTPNLGHVPPYVWAEIDALRERVRFWRYCYLTVCAQFAVVAVAAVWGWAR